VNGLAPSSAAHRGKELTHVAAWVGRQLKSTVSDVYYLAMMDAAFAVRAANIAKRRLARIEQRTASDDELADYQQLAEFEAMRSATSSYLTSLDLQASALEFKETQTAIVPAFWPDARKTANSLHASLQTWHARLKDGGAYSRLLALRNPLTHQWFRRDVTVGSATVNTAVLGGGVNVPFNHAELATYDELVVDQFIVAAYLLVTGTDQPPP
jgi:hypothetical protein